MLSCVFLAKPVTFFTATSIEWFTFASKMKAFYIRRIETRTYVRKEKTVASNRNYENDNMKIHLEMRGELASAINENTSCSHEFLASMKRLEFGPGFRPPELTALKIRSPKEESGDERRVGINSSSLQVFSILIINVFMHQITDALTRVIEFKLAGPAIFEV